MYNNEKIRNSIILFLSFCVLSSKNILIYNEETLVALSFFCFLYFVYRYFGVTIKELLTERSELIKSELQQFLSLKESNYLELLKEHQKVSGLVKIIKSIDLFTTKECTRLNSNVQKSLNILFITQLQQKLKNLLLLNSILQQKQQNLLSENIFSNVLLSFHKQKSNNLLTSNSNSILNILDFLSKKSKTTNF